MITLHFLTNEAIEAIHDVTLELLEKTGVSVKNEKTLALLKENGCEIQDQIVKFPSSLVEESIRKVPSTFNIYNREGNVEFSVGSDNVVFNPGSSAVYFKDGKSGEIRKGTENDCIELVKLVNDLEHIKFQSTALVPSDVPVEITGPHRLYTILKYSSKPIVSPRIFLTIPRL